MLAAVQVSLIMNLLIAAGLLVVFYGAFRFDDDQKGLLWSVVAVVSGLCGVALEVTIPHLVDARLVLLLSYGCYMTMVASISIAVAYCRNLRPPYRLLAGIATAFLLIRWATFGMPYDSLLRHGLQQSAYTVLQGFAIYFMLRRPMRGWPDWNLLAAAVASTLQYPLRSVLAYSIGMSDSPQGYLFSDYATLSNVIFAAVSLWIAVAGIILHIGKVIGILGQTAHDDPLTGLLNRRGLESHVAELEKASTVPSTGYAVILLDIDHFKAVNDSHGHAAGDAVLREVADIIGAVISYPNIAARYGGEEFVIVLRRCDVQTAVRCADNLRRALQATPVPELDHGHVTASFGVAVWHGEKSFFHILSDADEALYRAKNSGRNRVAIGAHSSPGEEKTKRKSPPVAIPI